MRDVLEHFVEGVRDVRDHFLKAADLFSTAGAAQLPEGLPV